MLSAVVLTLCASLDPRNTVRFIIVQIGTAFGERLTCKTISHREIPGKILVDLLVFLLMLGGMARGKYDQEAKFSGRTSPHGMSSAPASS